MAVNTILITPAISNRATLRASVTIDDITDDTKPYRMTINMTDNFGNPYGYQQTFSIASGVVVTAPNNQIVAFNSGDIAALTPDRFRVFFNACQDVLAGLKSASGTINVGPRG